MHVSKHSSYTWESQFLKHQLDRTQVLHFTYPHIIILDKLFVWHFLSSEYETHLSKTKIFSIQITGTSMLIEVLSASPHSFQDEGCSEATGDSTSLQETNTYFQKKAYLEFHQALPFGNDNLTHARLRPRKSILSGRCIYPWLVSRNEKTILEHSINEGK